EANTSAGRLDGGPRLVAEHELQDDAGADGDQHIVAAGLDPVVAAGRGAQAMAAPVVDHVAAAAVFHREPVAPVKTVVRAGATLTVVSVAAVVAALTVLLVAAPALLLVATLLTLSLQLPHAPLLRLLISIALGEDRSGQDQRHCHQGRDDCVTFHEALHCSAGVRSPHALCYSRHVKPALANRQCRGVNRHGLYGSELTGARKSW